MKAMNNSNFTRTFPRISHIIWIILVFISVRAGYYWLSDGFSVSKIKNTFPVEQEWKLELPSSREQKSLKTICETPFRYLGKGSQAYAFISEDKRYVLKLFKCYHLTPATWLQKLPLPEKMSSWRDETRQKRQKKIDSTLKSYKIAATSLRNECGVIAMEILPTAQFHQDVTLIDKIGREHKIDLGNYGFILQRRADLVYPSLSQWIENDQLPKAKKAIHSIVGLIVHRSKKGIQDSDPDLHKNAGLIGTDAIFIDVGSFHQNQEAKQPEVYIRDLVKITNNLKTWLQKQSPELATYLDNQMRDAESATWSKPSD